MPYAAAAAQAASTAGCRFLPRLVLSQLTTSSYISTRVLLHGAPLLQARGSTAASAAAAASAPATSRTLVRCCSSGAASDAAAGQPSQEKKRIVFCGTPEVAALVLKRLLAAAAAPEASFELAAVVTQPPRPTGRGNRKVPQPSPVEVAAAAAGLPAERILAPERPGDAAFLAALRGLSPDLCVTAAYGNYLPSSFLAIPPHGTLNIHPSLLPAYRGAAPVQRSLQDGVAVTGVTLLYTVKAMDAGPILAQRKVPVDPDIQAPQLLEQLFELGADLLVDSLEGVWAGMGQLAAQPQDEAAATHAAKLQREEAVLDFSQPALVCHNKVRGFAGWPSTFATFRQQAAGSTASGSSGSNAEELVELKLVRTRVAEPAAWQGSSEQEVTATKDGLFIRCTDGSVLQVLEVQAPGKRVMAARDFVNGLKGRTLLWQPLAQPAAAGA